MISLRLIELYDILGIDAHSSYCFMCFLFDIVIRTIWMTIKRISKKSTSKNTSGISLIKLQIPF